MPETPPPPHTYRDLMTRPHPDIAVRPITEPELPTWLRAVNTGFLRPPTVPQEELQARRAHFTPGRSLAAFDGETCVATFRSFPQELTAVGGTPVPADAITAVTVTATHRRRGLLTRMMAHDLAAAKARGDVVATLIAAEYRIYGRYGFGPATEPGTDPGHRRPGRPVARRRVRRTARRAGPGAGRTSGRRPVGRRPAAYVRAALVPGHVLRLLPADDSAAHP
jgi:GNAT superfamily N-acetyltransferase